MADYVPSSTGQGQGSAQVLEGKFTPINMDETVKSLDNFESEKRRQAAEQRAEARRQEAEQRAIEKKKEEERRKQQQKDANDLIKQRQTAESIANAGGTTTETNLAINQFWGTTQELMKEEGADLPQLLQNFTKFSTAVIETEKSIAYGFKGLGENTGKYKVYNKETGEYGIGLPPNFQALLDGTLYSSKEERDLAIKNGEYNAFLNTSMLEFQEDVVSLGDGSTLDGAVGVMFDSIDANQDEASGVNKYNESGTITTKGYTNKQKQNIVEVLTNNSVEKEKERNSLSLRLNLKRNDLGESFNYDGVTYENFDDYWGKAVKNSVSNVSGSTKFKLDSAEENNNTVNNNLEFESSNQTKGFYSGNRIVLPGVGTFSFDKDGNKVVQLKDGKIIPFDKDTRAEFENLIKTQPKERREAMLNAFDKWDNSEIIVDEVGLYVDNLLQGKSDAGMVPVDEDEEGFIDNVVEKYKIDIEQEGWTDFVKGLKDSNISDFEETEHRKRIIEDLKGFINATEKAAEQKAAEQKAALKKWEKKKNNNELTPKEDANKNAEENEVITEEKEINQEIYESKIIPVEDNNGDVINSYYGNAIKLKPEVADSFLIAYNKLKEDGITLAIADNYVSKEVKINAYDKWVEGGKKGAQQAGEKSFHIHGQAIDLNQEDTKMNSKKVFKALREAGFKQHPGEWWHWSIGEFTEEQV